MSLRQISKEAMAQFESVFRDTALSKEQAKEMETILDNALSRAFHDEWQANRIIFQRGPEADKVHKRHEELIQKDRALISYLNSMR